MTAIDRLAAEVLGTKILVKTRLIEDCRKKLEELQVQAMDLDSKILKLRTHHSELRYELQNIVDGLLEKEDKVCEVL